MRRNLTLAEQVAAFVIALAIGAGVKLSTDVAPEEPAVAVNAIPEPSQAPVKVGGTYYTASGSNSNSVVLSNTATTTSAWTAPGVMETAICGQGPAAGSPEPNQTCRFTRYTRMRDGKAEGSNDGAYWIPIYTPPAR